MHSNFNPSALAIHTTSPELGLAIRDAEGKTRCQTWNLGRDLSTQLHAYLAEFIRPQTWSDFDFLAVAKGPGSFTGTRIGVVTARVLAQQFDVPLFSLSALAAWVHYCQQRDETIPEGVDLAVQMSAARAQLFVGIYKFADSQLMTLLPDTVMGMEQWQDTLDRWSSDYYVMKADADMGRSVSSLLDLAYLEWQQGRRSTWWEAVPFYGQHPVKGAV